ncbi:MAG: 50S ribosomal protein L11 methyltransferase [Acidimicrobiales bacterium]
MPIVDVVVSASDVELAADALWQAQPSAVEEHDLGDGRVRLRADVRDLGLVDPRWSPALVIVDDGALDAWRVHARPVRAGRRMVLHPAWLPEEAGDADDVLVRLEPARTFGSGSHPTTRLAVAALETRLRPGHRVLDVGTGSGVLAVAAALLGASEAVGTDIDPAVVEVVAANARANAVAGKVRATTEPVASLAGPFDLVVANIGLGVLVELAPSLLATGAGLLVLTGLLEPQADEAVAAYPGLMEVERTTVEGWSLVVLRR